MRKWIAVAVLACCASLARGQCSGYSSNSPGATVLSTQQVAAQGGATATINVTADDANGNLLTGSLPSHRVTFTSGTHVGFSVSSNNGVSATMYSPRNGVTYNVALNGNYGNSWWLGDSEVGKTWPNIFTVTDANGNKTQDVVYVTVAAGNGPGVINQNVLPTNFYAYMSSSFHGPSMADACTLCQNQPYKCINKMHHPKQHWQVTNTTTAEYHDAGWVYGNAVCETCAVSYGGSSPFISFNPGDQLTFNVENTVICDEFGVIYDNNGGDTFDMETEYAFTTEQTKQSTCQVVGGGIQCQLAYFCKAGSTPPDFEPAYIFSNEFCANGTGNCTAEDIPTFPPFWLVGGGGIRVKVGSWTPWWFPFYDTAGYVYGVRKKSEFINFLFDVLDMALPWGSTAISCTNADLGTGPMFWP